MFTKSVVMRNSKFLFGFLMLCTLLFTSCDSFYFNKPQPVDSKSLVEFPKEYRGMWGEENDTTIIAEDHVMIVTNTESRVDRNDVDDNAQYKFSNDLVFVLSNEEGDEISNGNKFYWDQDTLVIMEREVTEIDLGKKTFLRKTDKGHLFNRKNENHWWEIYYLEKVKNGDVLIRSLKKDDLDKIKSIERIHEKDGDYYLKADWTKQDFEKVLESGGFTDTILVLEEKYRLRIKN